MLNSKGYHWFQFILGISLGLICVANFAEGDTVWGSIDGFLAIANGALGAEGLWGNG